MNNKSWTINLKDAQIPAYENENVNHPSHYAGSCSLECIDVMIAALGPDVVYDGCLMNCFKYLWRYKHKGKPEEDLGKAKWYLDKANEIMMKTDLKDNWYFDEDLYKKMKLLYTATVNKNGEK